MTDGGVRPIDTLPDGHKEWVLVCFDDGKWTPCVATWRRNDGRKHRVYWRPINTGNQLGVQDD